MRKILEFHDGRHPALATAVRVYRDHEWEEFRVRVYRNGSLYEPADYFTSDKEDAIDTAKAMFKQELKGHN